MFFLFHVKKLATLKDKNNVSDACLFMTNNNNILIIAQFAIHKMCDELSGGVKFFLCAHKTEIF